MNNRFSVRICDDNGNLMYSEDYQVRKIIKQGVVRDNKELIYVDRNISDGVSEGGYAAGSHKLILVAEYEGSFENETTISVPYQYKIKESIAVLEKSYTLYAGILKKQGVKGNNQTINALGTTLTQVNVNTRQDAVSGGVIMTGENMPRVYTSSAIKTNDSQNLIEFRGLNNDFFLSNQSFKGKRWLAVIPFENIYDTDYVPGQGWNNPLSDTDIFALITQNNAVCPIKYTIVEVE